jgi:hypothetical protein
MCGKKVKDEDEKQRVKSNINLQFFVSFSLGDKFARSHFSSVNLA